MINPLLHTEEKWEIWEKWVDLFLTKILASGDINYSHNNIICTVTSVVRVWLGRVGSGKKRKYGSEIFTNVLQQTKNTKTRENTIVNFPILTPLSRHFLLQISTSFHHLIVSNQVFSIIHALFSRPDITMSEGPKDQKTRCPASKQVISCLMALK